MKFQLTTIEAARRFLNNIYIGDKRMEFVTTQSGGNVRIEDIPEDQIIMRANELMSWLETRQ